MTFFVGACVLLQRANVPPVHASCGGFWEFMVAATVAPVVVPLSYFVLGMGAVSWRDFRAVAYSALFIAALYMTLKAGSQTDCIEALRATSPSEPWLLIFGWFKVVAFGGVAVSALISYRQKPTQTNEF